MKKPFLLITLFVLLAALPGNGRAQTAVTDLASLEIALWPDYDQPSTLALLTGALPPDTALPADVTIPLPEDADLLVVARITADGNMIDDIEYENDGGFVTFAAPETRFRIEYYFPYTKEGNQHTIDFAWSSPHLHVEELGLTIQQPASATRLSSDPAATAVTEGGDGLQYHALPATSVPAGQSYEATVEYQMNSAVLSVNALTNNAPVITPVITDSGETTAADSSETNWPVILGGIGGMLILLSLGFYLFTTRSQSKRPAKPRPLRSAQRPSTTRFCRQCGTAISSADKFCKNCGTAVRK